ncbi:hypothetical protein K1T71_014196 [Dendrolimus kikuchii]|uniref:Uncharacterized protein n=1 Tax=Dendrolimus kikuchii TaxID=765133 RepID=A0ACC1CFB1_9NEOP|nr:hypothetical protein K1T71_014196 [Dendrolimus kikuchii]
MAAKAALAICNALLFVQIATSQCINDIPFGLFDPIMGIPDFGANWGNGLYGPSPSYGYNMGYGSGCAPTSSGGGFSVTSSSPIAPTGLTVSSENAIEGALAVAGNLPFLGTVALDGAFPSAGIGAVSYGCGNGDIGIISEGPVGVNGPIAPGYGPMGPIGPVGPVGPAAYPGMPLPYNGRGCGY